MVSLCRRHTHPRERVLRWAVLVAPLALLACDGGGRTQDAQSPASAVSAELSVRFEVAADRPASVSVLGFRAVTAGPVATGPDTPDVLGLVDPLSAAAPVDGCLLRDVDLTASAFRSNGGSVDLEELGGVSVGLGPASFPGSGMIRPFPRLFPDVAGVVGGVVAQAGPQPVATVPEHVSVYSPDAELPIAELSVPALPRLVAVNGSAPAAGARVDVSGGLAIALEGGAGAGTLVEVRPFGATVAVSCAVPANGSAETLVTVPRSLLRHFGGRETTGDGVPVSLEIARRVRVRAPLAASATRVSVETRSALVMELRP